MVTKSIQARILITCVLAGATTILAGAAAGWQNENLPRFFCFLALTLLSCGMNFAIPVIAGPISMAFLFTLIGIQELSLSQTIFIATAGTVLQLTWHARKRANGIQILFQAASHTTAAYASWLIYHSVLFRGQPLENLSRLIFASGAYFLTSTLPVSSMAALTENRSLRVIWRECSVWALPYYLAAAAIAAAAGAANRMYGWDVTALILPVAFLLYRAHRVYLGRLGSQRIHAEQQKLHAQDMASLHLRTIEALALAIEAKDHTTHDHLRRVQVYALEIGKEMGLTALELDALRAAALLHDIGKLAVPEHIISKPGKLTPEEFEKMKIHPVIGGEILERVKFPYPVVPIVCAHHEKWNGKGYPYGLKGEEIPIGARILAAVDCLDAIASDRQYRRGLPLDDAMSQVLLESGKSYDPAVVAILHRRYSEFEQMAQTYQLDKAELSKNLIIENGPEPAVGFERTGLLAPPLIQTGDFLHSIAAARHEAQALFEMSQDLGNSLSLSETLSVLAVKLKRIIPHDSIAIYIVRDKKLMPEYVSGDDFRLFSSLEIPVGQGLSGWVAENRKTIINGNPSVEPGYLHDPLKFSLLRSALAVPLEGMNGVVGVLTLYHTDKDAFTRDHLRIVMALSAKVSLSIENALKFQQVECSATTDFLTELPNARSLFLHLETQVARLQRTGGKLAVLVCDVDGFKQVNDRFGHLQGNRVLQLSAKRIQSKCRECDYVARLGGDEFVLVLPGFEPAFLDHKVEQLGTIVAAVGREVCGEDLISLSVGAGFYPMDGHNPEQLLTVADGRMYEQKHLHRELAIKPQASWPRDFTTMIQ